MFSLLAVAPPLGAQIYKCEDASGQPTYQEAPCDPRTSTQRSILIQPPPPPPAKKERTPPAEPAARAERPAPVAPATRTDRSDAELAALLLGKMSCNDELPEFALRTQDGYAAWRKQNLQQVQRVERSESYRLSLVQYRLERALRPVSPGSAPAPEPEPDAADKVRRYADALCYGNIASALGLQVRP